MANTSIRVTPDSALLACDGGVIELRTVFLGGISRGAAIVLCDVGDLDTAAGDAMNRLAEHGYESVAAQLDPAAEDDALLSRVEVLVDHLGRRGWLRAQIGLLGFGVGGRAVLLASAVRPLGVAVAMWPSGVFGNGAAGAPPVSARTPLLVLVAGADPGCDAAQVHRYARMLDAASPASTEVIRYAQVTSGFAHDALEGPAHAAAFEAWQRTIETFDGHVAPRPTPLAQVWATRNPHPDSEVLDLIGGRSATDVDLVD